MLKKLNVVLAVLMVGSLVSNSFAIGSAYIGNEVPSARAAGQGYVGIAGQNNDPTAVYTNPGAMTSLKGTQATFGIHFENIHGAYKDDAGNETKERVTNVGVPNFSITHSFLDGKLSAGLSSQSPYGLETHWDNNTPMRYVATNSRLGLVDIMPAVAYQVHPMVSVGVGADYYNVFQAQLDRQINVDAVNSALSAPSAGSMDATSSLRGKAANWGYHAGVVFTPLEQHAFGIAYHSKVNLRLNGNLKIRNMSGAMAQVFGGSDFSTSAYTDIVIPQNVQFGYAYKPNEQWILEADTAWYHWSDGKDLNVRYPAIDANSVTGQTQLALLTNNGNGNPIALNPRDAWSVNVGANYKVNDRWQVRSGAWYEPWALPESTFSPAFVDLSRYGLSAGAGYHITENVSMDMAYTAVFFHNRTIHNNAQLNATGIPDGALNANTNGKYSDFANILAVNVTYRFSGIH